MVNQVFFTCNCVKTLPVEPVISAFNFRKCDIKRLSSFRFIPSNKDIGTNLSKPNSRLKVNRIFKFVHIINILVFETYSTALTVNFVGEMLLANAC